MRIDWHSIVLAFSFKDWVLASILKYSMISKEDWVRCLTPWQRFWRLDEDYEKAVEAFALQVAAKIEEIERLVFLEMTKDRLTRREYSYTWYEDTELSGCVNGHSMEFVQRRSYHHCNQYKGCIGYSDLSEDEARKGYNKYLSTSVMYARSNDCSKNSSRIPPGLC